MKKTSFLIMSIVLPFILFSVNVPQCESKIEEATVYLFGAEIKSSAKINISQGRGMIEILGISPHAIDNSIQISNKQDIEILSVSVSNYHDNAEIRFPELKRMNDSISLFNSKIVALVNEKTSYESELEHLTKNINIGGANTGVNTNELKSASTYFRERNFIIRQEISKIEKEISKHNEVIAKINSRKSKILNENNFSFKKVIIEYEANININAIFEISYISGKCGWAPAYDLKASDIGEPVLMKYKAKVYNNTGLAWETIKLRLSTGDPLQGATAPDISTWNLNFQDVAAKSGYFDNAIRQEKRQFDYAQHQVLDASFTYNTIAVSELSVEFEIAKKYNIPPDGKPYTIDVTEYSLNAEFSHYAIPKYESNVYLIAKVTGWESLNLIDGDMNMYFGDTYLGVSKLNTNSLNDTLELSFGRDKQVSITRTRVEEFTKKSFLGNSQRESFMFEILVKNNRKSDIKISVVDQLPLSNVSDIEVTAVELSGAEYNNITGKLSWIINLKPSESKKVGFGYNIKYPKNYSLNTKQVQYRSVRAF